MIPINPILIRNFRERNEKNIKRKNLETPKPKPAEPGKSILKSGTLSKSKKKKLIFASPSKDESPQVIQYSKLLYCIE